MCHGWPSAMSKRYLKRNVIFELIRAAGNGSWCVEYPIE